MQRDFRVGPVPIFNLLSGTETVKIIRRTSNPQGAMKIVSLPQCKNRNIAIQIVNHIRAFVKGK
jgi:hypothetical protein